MAVKPEEAVQRLTELRDEAATLPTSVNSGEFSSWELRVVSTLTHALGEKHHITERFRQVSWVPMAFSSSNADAAFQRRFVSAAGEAQGVISGAIAEIELLSDEVSVADGAGVDAELWEHVVLEIQAEAWAKASAQACIFTEDRIRKWAGRPAEEVGEKLMTAVLGDNGDFKLGRTQGERQGWHRLGMGLSMAVRNVDAHRIQDRADIKRYALGVIGSCSLLLTQLRFEHGNRFQDTSPTPIAEV